MSDWMSDWMIVSGKTEQLPVTSSPEPKLRCFSGYAQGNPSR
jgi:hypothetical protein